MRAPAATVVAPVALSSMAPALAVPEPSATSFAVDATFIDEPVTWIAPGAVAELSTSTRPKTEVPPAP
jgi:hypothetical protein